MERLESNSITTGAKAAKKKPTKSEERQKIEKVVKNRVTTQKKSLGQKFGETFLSDETGGVGSYIFNDVLIPALKDTFVTLEDDHEDVVVLVVEASSGYRMRIDSIVTADVNRHLEVGLDMKWII